MKHLKLANSEQDFQLKQNIQKCDKMHIVVYTRSDEEYNYLVTNYENNPEDCNYVYPKRVLINCKKQLSCKMEYSYSIINNKLLVSIKITQIDSNIDLNNFVLLLQSYSLKSKDKYIWECIGIIENPVLNTTYTINPAGGSYISRGKNICQKKGILESDFNIEWKVRPALIHKSSNVYLGGWRPDQQYENIVETQDPLIIKCTLDKVFYNS